MKLTWAKFNLVTTMGVVAFAVYILVDALTLPAGLKQQLTSLSPLAQQIGATCHNDGDGEWIQSFVKSDGTQAVSGALSELISIPDIAVSGCAISHVNFLKMTSAAPALEKVALNPNNPHNGWAKSVLKKIQG